MALCHSVLTVFEGMQVIMFLLTGIVNCVGMLTQVFHHTVYPVLRHLGTEGNGFTF